MGVEHRGPAAASASFGSGGEAHSAAGELEFPPPSVDIGHEGVWKHLRGPGRRHPTAEATTAAGHPEPPAQGLLKALVPHQATEDRKQVFRAALFSFHLF